MAKSGCFQEADQRVEGPRTYVIVKSLWALFVFLYYAYFPLGEKKANFMQSARLSEIKKKVVAFYQEISKIKVKEYTSRRGCGETPVLAHCWPAGPAAVGPLVTTRAPPATAAAGASPVSLPPFCSFLCFGVSLMLPSHRSLAGPPSFSPALLISAHSSSSWGSGCGPHFSRGTAFHSLSRSSRTLPHHTQHQPRA